MFRKFAARAAVLLLISGCAPGAKLVPTVLPAVSAAVGARAQAPAETATEAAVGTARHITGNASWYGPGFAGRHTANGEIFNPAELTAAHRTLPFNTRVRVTHVATGQSVTVRINDRGPFRGDRIIDLSRAAADAIGLTASGVGLVEMEVLSGDGVVTGAPTSELTPFEVVARGRSLGELLLLSPALEGSSAPVMVRVVGTEPPPEADLLMSEQLFAQLGTDVVVSGD